MNINSDLVKTLRAERLWSQEQLSEACGLNLRTIQRLENTGKASIESVKALAAVFEIDTKDLLVNQSKQTMTPIEVLKTGAVKFANFSDHATRFEYWWFFLFVALSSAVAAVIHVALLQLVSIIALLPLIAVGTRRLNDLGRSGWWQLLFLVPFGMVVVFYMFSLKGRLDTPTPGTKSFDPA